MSSLLRTIQKRAFKRAGFRKFTKAEYRRVVEVLGPKAAANGPKPGQIMAPGNVPTKLFRWPTRRGVLSEITS